jgi:hypothetical protein
LEKIEVVANGAAEDHYVLKDGLGEVSENAFRERYKRLMGATNSLGGGARGTPAIVVGSAILAAGLVAAVVLSSSQGASGCTPTVVGCVPDSSSSSSISTGAAFALTGAGLVGTALIAGGIAANQRGHSLTRVEAERYCDSYNRALLGKIAREATVTR